jgi:diguanylate cyclase (GGDEF)-like protein/PAS domain S-box-containing protein
MISGAIGDERAVELLKSGARDYVLKDRLVCLASAVQRVLQENQESLRRQQAEQALRESEAKFRAVNASAQDGILMFDGDGRISLWNQAAEKIFGYLPERALGRPLHDLLMPARYRPVWEHGLQRFSQTGESPIIGRTIEMIAVRANGTEFPIEVSTSRLVLAGRWNGLGIVRDITERRRSEEKLRQAGRVFDHATEGIVVADEQLKVVAVNKAFIALTGYAECEAVGMDATALSSDRHDADFYQAIRASLRRTGVWRGEVWKRRKCGEVFPSWCTISVVENDDGGVTHYVGVFADISSAKRSEQALQFVAHHDALTELPNRRLCKDRIDQAIERARSADRKFAVLFIDLDHFKGVNDTLGHPAGDELLRVVASRMAQTLQAGETLARTGGDEFVLVMERDIRRRRIAARALQVNELLAQPIPIDGRDLFVTASLGISRYPQDGADAHTLLRNADLAMYRAKTEGRNRFHFYTAALTVEASDRLLMENALRRAQLQGELSLVYQPQVRLRDGALAGMEALLRWQHPQLGAVPPSRFIPLAEDMGIIGQLGEFALREACCQAMRWRKQGVHVPRMAVNLSVQQLEQEGLAPLVRAVLLQTGLDATGLELEVTESALMRRTDRARRTMDGLRRLGVSLAVDDFGIGYSSLSYLKQLPVHRLKIDYTFVRGIGQDASDEAIVRAIIGLGHSLGLEVLAEGIEHESQVHWLLSEGCQLGQGYLFGRPAAAECVHGGAPSPAIGAQFSTPPAIAAGP